MLEPAPVTIGEYADGAARAAVLFQRKFASPPPPFPRHVLAYAGSATAQDDPLCYVHFTEVDAVLLGGGACVDARRLRRLPAEARAWIAAQGGPYFLTLDWATKRYAARFPAIFGYCGDAAALRVDLAVGFEPTKYPHLIVLWTRALAAAERERLIEQVNLLGPF